MSQSLALNKRNAIAFYQIAFCACLLFCVGCVNESGLAPAFDVSYPNNKVINGKGNTLNITLHEEQMRVDVSSQSGIGSGLIRLTQGEWPKVLQLRFHLKKLEGLTLKTATKTLTQDDVSIVSKEKGAYYEVELSTLSLLSDSQEILIKWIDFYR